MLRRLYRYGIVLDEYSIWGNKFRRDFIIIFTAAANIIINIQQSLLYSSTTLFIFAASVLQHLVFTL